MYRTACSNEQKKPIIVTPLTGGGQPAQVDGPLRITVQSGDGSFEQDPAEPLTFKAVSGTAVADATVPGSGETVYLVEADKLVGDGVELISDQVVLTVTSAQAASLGISEGPAETK